ncbi:uncharacterized protein DUF2547 [Cricetibacter osteomyelitidis]|uniref:Uncharacterized protein DUF2547 n=1 Tax=Cricetibacter osteomyelitidis TaxID=1521931 RepID=A0A4V2T224_9PAST|nr:secA translation cis-regulator SecM [Cricetibacter osteomyelitidis]TCP95753.1 uncharacterized protein DUF2547 [Cricetibacter osteomyelitidis]
MIRNKNKHSLWSQILAGMIAIFLLPATQPLENRTAAENTYQNEQTLQPQSLFDRVLQFKQTQQTQIQSYTQIAARQKFLQIEPHFAAFLINPLAPIRAGPVLA